MKTQAPKGRFAIAAAITLSLLSLFACRPPDGLLDGSGADTGDSGILSVSTEVKTLKVTGGNTYLKISTAPAYTLSDSSGQRCTIFRDTTLRYTGELSFADNHLKITLTEDTQPGCPFRTGYLFGDKYRPIAEAANAANEGKGDPTAANTFAGNLANSIHFSDYNASMGRDLAAAIKKPAYCSPAGKVVNCASGSLGCCYSCVAGPNASYPGALSRILPSLGRAAWPVGSATELNTSSYASSFAKYFVPARHESITHMRAAYLKGKNASVDKVGGVSGRFKMPVGSVIVWSSCSASAAGHIAIVTEEGKTACSDFCGSLDQCSPSNIIGLFYPYK